MGYILCLSMFEEKVDLQDARYTEKTNLEYAVMKTRHDLLKLPEEPDNQEYQKRLERFQYYLRLYEKKYPWEG